MEEIKKDSLIIMNDEGLFLDNYFIKKSIQEAMPTLFKEMFSRSYSNPVLSAMEEFLKNNKDGIQKIIKEIMEEIIADVGFKEEMKNIIIANILKNNFK